MAQFNISEKAITADLQQKATEDVQGRFDHRKVSIDSVGICDLKIPLIIGGCERNPNRSQSVQGNLNVSVDLDASRKGIHMSRLVETVLDHYQGLSLGTIGDFLKDLCNRQAATDAYAKIEFDYFFSRVAPVSGISSPQAYRCFYQGKYSPEGLKLKQSVEVPVKTLCPCSKEISDYGAHNQRSKVWITLTHIVKDGFDVEISLEEVVEIAESGASSPLYPILKREDERFITMNAYDKPCFVEDVVRNIATVLRKDKRFNSFEVKVINYESIHSHNAFAHIKEKNIEKS